MQYCRAGIRIKNGLYFSSCSQRFWNKTRYLIVNESMKRYFCVDSKLSFFNQSIRMTDDLTTKIDLVDQMIYDNVKPDIFIFNSLMRSCISERDLVKCLLIYERELERFNIKPNADTYKIIIYGCSSLGTSEKILEIYNSIKFSKEFQPTKQIMNMVIEAYINEDKTNEIPNFIKEMKKLNIKLDKIAYNTMINACSKKGRWDRVDKLLQKMKLDNLNPDIYTYSCMMLQLGRQGKLSKVLDIFSSLSKNNLIPNDLTINALMESYIHANNLDKAIEIARKSEYKISKNILSMLICALADNDRIFDAEIIKEQMKLNQKEIPNAKTFNTLLDAYCRNNNYSKRFKKLVNEMIEKKIFINPRLREEILKYIPNIYK